MDNIVYIIDAVLIIVIIVCAFKAYKDGFASSIVNLGGSILAFLGAYIFSGKIADFIFINFLRENITQKTFEYFTTAADSLNVENAVKNILGFLPDEIIQNFTSIAQTSLEPSYQSAQIFTDTILMPIMTAILSIIFFILCYFLFKIIVNLVARVLKIVNAIPLIGFANKILGFAVGTLTGGVYIIVIYYILTFLTIFMGDNSSFLNYTLISQSKILTLASAVLPFML